MGKPFDAGDKVLLIDPRARRYLVTLKGAGRFDTHAGSIEHDLVIGSQPGTTVYSTSGRPFIALRPTLADFVLKMPRGAQVVYPKDIGAILVGADIHPGARVLEAGTGSGSLTLALVRAVGDHGLVISYERREDFAERARANVSSFLGGVPAQLELREGDVTDGVPETGIDRVVLDLPEPWRVVPVATRALAPGGIFCSYVPSVVQVSQVTDALRAARFIDVQTSETLVRTWHVEGPSVRPDHRMVAHTGFVTTARFLGPGE